MKLRLSRKHIFFTGGIVLALLAGGIAANCIWSDPILKEVEKYREEDPLAAEREKLQRQIEAIVNDGQNVNVADEHGYTPLMRAAKLGSYKELDYLLVKGARLHRPGPQGQSLLDMAANDKVRTFLQACLISEKHPTGREREQMIQDLRQAGINPDDLNKALFDAVCSWRGNSLILTAKVLALGGNANAFNDEQKHILQHRHRDAGTIVLLLRQGAKPNAARDEHGGSLALLEHLLSDPRFTRNLLTAKASVKSPSIVAKAAGAGYPATLRRLLELGARPDGMTRSGLSVLEYAVQGRNLRAEKDIPACVKLLLEAGAPMETKGENGRMRSPISPGGMSIMPECIRLLVDAGANVNTLNSRGANYAQVAATKKASRENLALLEDIIDAGADLSHKDDHGESFLFYALSSLCRIELQAEDEDTRDEAEDLFDDMMDIIEDSRPAPADLDKNGNTALHLAVIKRGQAGARVVEYLLKLGVDPKVRNKFGRTALEALLMNPTPGCAESARLLAPVSDPPRQNVHKLRLAALLGDAAAMEKVLQSPIGKSELSNATQLTMNAQVMDLLLSRLAGYGLNYRTLENIARKGTPELIEVLGKHQRQQDLGNYWSEVRSPRIAQAFLAAGVKAPLAERLNSAGVLKELLKSNAIFPNGQELNMSHSGTSLLPLPAMVNKGDADSVHCLLEAGASVDGYPVSPLSLTDNAEIARLLIGHGADLTWQSPHGDTLLSQRKRQMKDAALRYHAEETEENLEAFRQQYQIYQLLSEAGAPDIHPRKHEIKEALRQADCEEAYKTVDFVCRGWSGTVRISKEAMVLARSSGNTDSANILSLTPTRMHFKWDRWGFGTMELRADGKWHETDLAPTSKVFRQKPTREPHYFVPFLNESGSQDTLFLQPDLKYAVVASTGKYAAVRKLARHYTGSTIKLNFEDGQTMQLILHDGKMKHLTREVARQLLRSHRCPIDFKEFKIAGRGWSDSMRLSTDFSVAARQSRSQDTAEVESFTDNRLVLKWDRWGYEVFLKHPDGIYRSSAAALTGKAQNIRRQLRESSPQISFTTHVFVHPAWQSKVNISREHLVAVQLRGKRSAAEIININADSITLRWDEYNVETFELRKDGRFYKKR